MTTNDAPDELRGALEVVLLVLDSPISVEELADIMETEAGEIQQHLTSISGELRARLSGIDLRETTEGWRFYTCADYADYVERALLDEGRGNLTRAALETLAVIAYRQPVTRSQVSAVRGVNADGVMRTLEARGLICDNGTDPGTGGVLFCTTALFLEQLGIDDLSALPELAPLLPQVDVIDDLDAEVTEKVNLKYSARMGARDQVNLTGSEESGVS